MHFFFTELLRLIILEPVGDDMPYMLYTDANTYNILSGTCKHLHNCRQIISNTKVH